MIININEMSFNGQREAGYKELIKLADYFEVSIDYLLERTDNPKFNK